MLLKDTPLATIDMKIVDVTIPIHNENIENLLASLKKVDKYLKTLSTELAFNYTRHTCVLFELKRKAEVVY